MPIVNLIFSQKSEKYCTYRARTACVRYYTRNRGNDQGYNNTYFPAFYTYAANFTALTELQ